MGMPGEEPTDEELINFLGEVLDNADPPPEDSVQEWLRIEEDPAGAFVVWCAHANQMPDADTRPDRILSLLEQIGASVDLQEVIIDAANLAVDPEGSSDEAIQYMEALATARIVWNMDFPGTYIIDEI